MLDQCRYFISGLYWLTYLCIEFCHTWFWLQGFESGQSPLPQSVASHPLLVLFYTYNCSGFCGVQLIFRGRYKQTQNELPRDTAGDRRTIRETLKLSPFQTNNCDWSDRNSTKWKGLWREGIPDPFHFSRWMGMAGQTSLTGITVVRYLNNNRVIVQ